EVRHGTPVRVRQFQLAKEVKVVPSMVAQRPDAPTGPNPPWRGHVEPIPFPFRLGISGKLNGDLLDFEATGAWLLAGTEQGMLHAIKTDGSASEMLPRGMLNGQLLSDVHAVLGVVHGFVVAGAQGSTLVAYHYDLNKRVCTGHALGR